MIGLNYLDKFIPIIKNKLNISLHNKELNYKGEIKYSRKETPYRLRYGVYKYYIREVRGNEDCTYKEVVKKLSSNALSGVKMSDDREGVEVYRYGNMAIKIQDDEIVYICNNNGWGTYNKYEFNVDIEYRDYLRELWGI